MRTRRIAIRCRRTGRSAAVAIGSTGTGLPADPPVPEMPPSFGGPPGHESLGMLDLPSLYGAPAAGTPAQGDDLTAALPPGPALSAAPGPVDITVPAYLADPGPADPSTGRTDPSTHPSTGRTDPSTGRAAFGSDSTRHGPSGPRPASPGDSAGRGTVNPWRSNRGPDLTLADILARPGRHDPDWNRNPGWPGAVGWAHIAHAAGGRPPRHARAGRRWIRWRARGRAAAWTGITVLATAAVMLVAELLR
jgi:hypothetical protein